MRTLCISRQRGLRISTAMASSTLLWRQHGHVVGCDHSIRRRTTALAPFFVRTLPDPRAGLDPRATDAYRPPPPLLPPFAEALSTVSTQPTTLPATRYTSTRFPNPQRGLPEGWRPKDHPRYCQWADRRASPAVS